MFTQNNIQSEQKTEEKNDGADELKQSKYKNIINLFPGTTETNEMNYSTIDSLLEKEKQPKVLCENSAIEAIIEYFTGY